MDLGNAIKTIRKQKKLTQKQLAESCKVSINTICSIEKGVTFPAKNTINKICQALQIPEAYLLMFSITEEDIPEGKKILYRTLCEPFRNELINEL